MRWLRARAEELTGRSRTAAGGPARAAWRTRRRRGRPSPSGPTAGSASLGPHDWTGRLDGTTGRDGQMGVECRVEQSIAEPVRSSDHDSGAARVKSLDSGQ